MSYQIIETTSDGFVTHTASNADLALSLWYAIDGEVQAIKDENQQEIAITDLVAEVAAKRAPA